MSTPLTFEDTRRLYTASTSSEAAFVVNFLFPVTSIMSPVILLSSNEVMPIIRSLTGLRRLFPQPRYKIRCRFLNIFQDRNMFDKMRGPGLNAEFQMRYKSCKAV